MADKKPTRPGRPESFRPSRAIDQLRVPPQSVEAEQNVVGALMLVPERLASVRLLIAEADFFRRDHRLVFRAICELSDKGKVVDPVTIGEYLEASQLAEQVGGAAAVNEMASYTHSAVNVLAYAEIVREKSIMRQAIEEGTALANLGYDPAGKDAGEILSQAQTALSTLALTATNARLMHAADLRSIMGEKVVPPQFVMAPYYPREVVTLFGGHGGAGKSTLALVHAAHVAAGKWWAGHKVEPGKVVLFTLEDNARTAGYRLQHIVEEYGLDADRVFANLRVFDWSEGDTALVVEKSEFGIHTLEPTQLFARMKIAAVGADLVLIDNASDAFDGNENSKRQVRAFFHQLKTGIAQPNRSAVVLLAHIDKNAARYGAAGNSYTGSTAWHNSARSRLALVESKEDGLELRQEKANFGKKAEPTPLRLTEHGVMVPCVAGDGPKTLDEGQDAAGVLAAIRAAAVGGTNVGTGRAGPGNAHQVLSSFGALPARLRNSKGKDAFYSALDALVSTGRVVVVERYTSGKNRRRYLVEAGTEAVGSGPGDTSLFSPTPPHVGTDGTNGRSSVRRQFGDEPGTHGTNGTNGDTPP